MKSNQFYLKLLAIGFLFTLFTSPTFAAGGSGGDSGGGGDATEMGVDLIRGDILKWIAKGGSKSLKDYPEPINNSVYVKKMSRYLTHHFVVIGFVTTQQEHLTQDSEQKVSVAGNSKACRGFISRKDSKPHILCNTERYPTGGPDQYRLIHHEYAGLAGVEKNISASSDYTLSNQITECLVKETIFRLAIKEEHTSFWENNGDGKSVNDDIIWPAFRESNLGPILPGDVRLIKDPSKTFAVIHKVMSDRKVNCDAAEGSYPIDGWEEEAPTKIPNGEGMIRRFHYQNCDLNFNGTFILIHPPGTKDWYVVPKFFREINFAQLSYAPGGNYTRLTVLAAQNYDGGSTYSDVFIFKLKSEGDQTNTQILGLQNPYDELTVDHEK